VLVGKDKLLFCEQYMVDLLNFLRVIEHVELFSEFIFWLSVNVVMFSTRGMEDFVILCHNYYGKYFV
jgi:hypothetical protein